MWSTDYVQVPVQDPMVLKSSLKLGVSVNVVGSHNDDDDVSDLEKLGATSPMTPEHKAQEMIRRFVCNLCMLSGRGGAKYVSLRASPPASLRLHKWRCASREIPCEAGGEVPEAFLPEKHAELYDWPYIFVLHDICKLFPGIQAMNHPSFHRLSLVDGNKSENSEIGIIIRSESESSLSDEDSVSLQGKSKQTTLTLTKSRVTISSEAVEEAVEATSSSVSLKAQDSHGDGVQMRTNNRGSGGAASTAMHRCSTVLPGRDSLLPGDVGSMRISRSDTSIADSFVLVSAADVPESDLSGKMRKQEIINKRFQNRLRDGFKWQCQLVFRSKLTMHTAFDRKDNNDPAAITSLAVSK